MPSAFAKTVSLVYSNNQEVFTNFAQEAHARLTQRGHQVTLIDQNQISDAALNQDLIIVAGAEAFRQISNTDVHAPVLAVLLSRDAYETYAEVWRSPVAHSAIFHDPPPLRQLLLTRALLPNAKYLGYLYKHQNVREYQRVLKAAELTEFEVQALAINSSSEISSALNNVLRKSDVMLASADPFIYNGQSLKTILMAAYRQNKTLIGSTPAFVKAGSVASTYTQPADIINQIVKWSDDWTKSTVLKLPPEDYAVDFDIAVKADVARSLGIQVPDSIALRNDIQAKEMALKQLAQGHIP